MSQKVCIETEECIGCENCVELCPDVFGFDDSAEKAFVLKSEGGSEECIEEAIETCPVECIHWE
jgi:ferredoxin